MSNVRANGEKDDLDGDIITPRIIPRSDHPISRNNIDKEALKVLYRLRDAGHTAFLVGGGVRDLYLGKTPKDFDISTDARPGQLRKLFRNSRLIGRRFRLVQVFFHGNKIIEVSTFRKRSEYDINGEEQVLASNNTFGTPEEDAFRRDLTINGLFYEIENFSIIDYTGGVEDLDNGIIRVIGEAERRMIRDPARMLRVIRHAARNNFVIETSAWEAIREHRNKLTLCPVSRVRDEFMKDLRGGASASWVVLAVDSGLFEVILPCYEDVLQNDHGVRKLLRDILTVTDRLLAAGAKFDDHTLLALLLIPWAEEELSLSSTVLKGKEAYQFTRTIRSRVDDILNHLSIKKSSKEAITTLLANLSLFKRYDREDDSWPKWLKKKSYFPAGRRFFYIYQEALGEHRVDADLFLAQKEKKQQFSNTRKRKKRPPRTRPAVAPKGRGSIFGLKK